MSPTPGRQCLQQQSSCVMIASAPRSRHFYNIADCTNEWEAHPSLSGCYSSWRCCCPIRLSWDRRYLLGDPGTTCMHPREALTTGGSCDSFIHTLNGPRSRQCTSSKSCISFDTVCRPGSTRMISVQYRSNPGEVCARSCRSYGSHLAASSPGHSDHITLLIVLL